MLFVGADEDDWNEIVVPRLHAAGADLERVLEFYGDDDTAVFNVVDHIEELDDVLRERAYALVVFEQLMDVLPPMKNPNDPVALRAALRPLRRCCAPARSPGSARCTSTRRRRPALRQKMQGSMQFGALSRSTVLVDRHPEDEDRRVAVLGKANYVRPSEPRALTFSIESAGSCSTASASTWAAWPTCELEATCASATCCSPPTERDQEREERADQLADALTERAADRPQAGRPDGHSEDDRATATR